MNREEKLLEMHKNMMDKYYSNNMSFHQNPSTERMLPFKIADDLYYVGDKKVCVHMIDTGDGLILIDSGFPGTCHLLIDSIWRLGFDPADVKWIIHSHAHYDHFGASEEFRKMFGTKLAISRADAESVKKVPHRSHINNNLFPFLRTPEFDYEIEDGEIFRLGNKEIRCVLTPGHTIGVLSMFFEVTDNGKKHLAGTFGGAGTNALTLPYITYNDDPCDMPQKMLESIELLMKEPVTIHLGNHPYNSDTLSKREKQLKDGGNPFVSPDSWISFLNKLKSTVENIIKENEKLNEKLM